VIDPAVIADRLTRERLSSYLVASGGDLDRALRLYEWNTLISGELHEDIGRVEVVPRNALDQALAGYGQQSQWPTPWYLVPAALTISWQARSTSTGRHQHGARSSHPRWQSA
jgi:hypothetical protein